MAPRCASRSRPSPRPAPRLWTLGQYGGYATNSPAITNDKFILEGMICPESDGSFWITDLATENRTMHFSACATSPVDRGYPVCTFLHGRGATRTTPRGCSRTSWNTRSTTAKPFTENQGWTPVNNWSYLNGVDLEPIASYGSTRYGLLSVATLEQRPHLCPGR